MDVKRYRALVPSGKKRDERGLKCSAEAQIRVVSNKRNVAGMNENAY